VWNKIKPNKTKLGGILCFSCIVKRLEEGGFVDVPVRIVEGEGSPIKIIHERK